MRREASKGEEDGQPNQQADSQRDRFARRFLGAPGSGIEVVRQPPKNIGGIRFTNVCIGCSHAQQQGGNQPSQR